jgi:hypothetical protein
MQCEQLKERLADYWAGTLSQADRHAIEAHVAACEPCRQEAAELGETWRALGTIADEEPSPALEARFHAMLDAWRDGERAATATAIAANAAGAAVASGANVLTMTPVSRSVTSKGRSSLSGQSERETRASFWRPALQMAAAVLILVGGFAAGRNWPNAAHEQARNEVSELRGELRGMREMVAMTLLQQDSAIGRLQGVSWSHQLERPSDQVLATLLDTLRHDPNFNVRLASIDALRAFAGEDSVRTGLVEALGSKGTTSPMVQIALIDALTDLRERRSVDALRTLADDTKQIEAVRQRARRGIQQLSS